MSEHTEAAVRAARAMLEARRLYRVTAEDKLGFDALHDAEMKMERDLDTFAALDAEERCKEAVRTGADGGG